MKKFNLKLLPIALLIMGSITISSCALKEDADEAKVTVEKFYQKMKDQDYDALAEMIDDEGLAANTKEEWITVIKRKETLGDFKGYDEGFGWHTSINNGVTEVQVDYITHYEQLEDVYERFVLIKRGKDGFKVLNYQFNQNKSELQEILK